MSKFKKMIAPLFVAVTMVTGVVGLSVVPTQSAGAQPLKDAACQGVSLGGGSGCDDAGDPNNPNSSASQINRTVETVINILSLIVGIAAVIMIIIGGFRYITSSGDSNNVNAAKNTIMYALIGLVVVALAQFIVRFVLSKL